MSQRKPPATFTLRIPRDLGVQVRHNAEAARMSMNTWVLCAIDQALATKRVSPSESNGGAKK
jgi:predicted HicB family RNase H-like nuclease